MSSTPSRQFSFSQRQVLEAVQSKIIPWVEQGTPFVMLEPPPFVVSRGAHDIVIQRRPAPALPAVHGIGDRVRARHWHDKNLNAYNVPYWGCVMEGEADLVIGITREMCEERQIDPAQWIVSLPQGSIFWMPPGVAVTMSGLHWERPTVPASNSRVFWMHVTQIGANCHFCSTSEGKHWEHPFVFVPTAQLEPLAQRISAELKNRGWGHCAMIEYAMQMLLTLTVRAMHEQPAIPPDYDNMREFISGENGEDALKLAQSYINAHFKEADLKVEHIANHAHLSSVHLGRLFRKHLGCTVWEEVTRQRFEYACQLLSQTNFNIRQISLFCGYAHSSTFITAFEKRFGKSPSAYRTKSQEEEKTP